MTAGGRATIAVVVPVHDKGPLVRRAIDSILAQARPADEIIIVDDASTDDSMAYPRSLEHPAVRLLERDRPGPGGYAARNLGVASATSEWITFLDADDAWQPGYLAEIASLVERADESVGCVFTGFEKRERGRLRRAGLAAIEPEAGVRQLGFDGFLELWLGGRATPLCVDVACLRRSLLDACGGFPADRCAFGGDQLLWLRAMARTRAWGSPFVGATYDRDASDVTRQPHEEPPCALAEIIALRDLFAGATGERLQRLYNLLAYRAVRSRAGRRRIVPGVYADFSPRLDPLTYLAVRLMAAAPVPLARLLRAAARAIVS